LILNAGSVTAGLEKNQDGVDLTFASTLVGHHVLSIMLLERGILTDKANIVIAGSEAARGDVQGMGLPDFDEISKDEFQGDIENTFEAFARGFSPGDYHVMKAYSIAKLYVAWWTATLAKKLPRGIRVFTISPGSVPSTNFARHQSFVLRRILLPLIDSLGRVLGVGGPVSAGAKRYISAVDLPDGDNGKFFASPTGKMIGELTEQKTDLLLDENKRKAAWNTIVGLAGGMNYSGKEEKEIKSAISVA
jgi:NAD(P)-dependent dehydrogenase (short-subunit alcohol dehydrogenase family)